MAQFPDLPPTTELNIEDEVLLRQNLVDKRIPLYEAVELVTGGESIFSSIEEVKSESSNFYLGKRLSSPLTEWVVVSAPTYTLPTQRIRTFNNLDIGNGFYLSLVGTTIFASDFMNEDVTATNEIEAGEISSIMRDGTTLDFSGNMYRVYANTAGIPSSTADPATSVAQPLDEMLYVDDLQGITFTNGGLYAANAGQTFTKSYFPNTFSATNCRGVTFTDVTFEAKGESWGDSDDSLPLSWADRLVFMPSNAGCALFMGRCVDVRGRGITARLSGSTSPLYFSVCDDVAITDSFSNTASLGYACYTSDSWVGTISHIDTDKLRVSLTNCSSNKETLFRREDGITSVGSSVYCGKGWVATEDLSVHATVTGGYCSDMYANGDAKWLGYVFGVGSGSTLVATGFECKEVQSLVYLFWSTANTVRVNISNFKATVGLHLVLTEDASIGNSDVTISNGDVHMNNSRAWAGETEDLSSSHVICNRTQSTTNHFTLNDIRVNAGVDHSSSAPSTVVWANDVTKIHYGRVVINGGFYKTVGRLCRVKSWGAATANQKQGLIATGGAEFFDVGTAAGDYIAWGNSDGAGQVYSYVDLSGSVISSRTIRRNLDNGGGYVESFDEGYWLPKDKGTGYTLREIPMYKTPYSDTFEAIGPQGLSDTNTLYKFSYSANKASRNSYIIDDSGNNIKILGVFTTDTSGGGYKPTLLLEGDVRTNFGIAGDLFHSINQD